jgi:hypothetical protein
VKRVTLAGLCGLFLVLFVSNSFAMMGMMKMMESSDPQPRLICAEQWIKKAIDLHELHIKDPKTATEASQMEMMDQMKKAYACVAEKSSESENTSQKDPAGEKKDAHKH